MTDQPEPRLRRSAWCTPAWGLNRVGAEQHATCRSRVERGLLEGCVCPCHEQTEEPQQ